MNQNVDELPANIQFLYRLNEPTLTHKLPQKLNEVSGIYHMKSGEFACVQDERGSIFIYDTEVKEVNRSVKFGKKGDYEGLAIVGTTAYVLENNGNIFEISNYKDEAFRVTKHKSFLNEYFDAEGLGYDFKNNRLLIACKGIGSAEYKKEGRRNIYAFDLETKETGKTPVYSIVNKDIVAYFKKLELQKEIEELEVFLNENKTDCVFSPSEVAVHPVTGDIYVLSAFSKMFIALDAASGSIVYAKILSAQVHRQPEGISIDKDGTLWISNEGKSGKATIYRFEPV